MTDKNLFLNRPKLYYKPARSIEPILDLALNERAIDRLENLRNAADIRIPRRFLDNWPDVALYHPKGDVEKAHALILNPEDGAYDLDNKLNDMTGKEWTKFTCSWFIFNAIQSDLAEERSISPDSQLHPATYSPTMVESFIRFFTKEGDRVFDPFLGIGSTTVAAKRTGRLGGGIELNPIYRDVAIMRTPEFTDQIFLGNSEKLDNYDIEPFEFSISSPPYWDVLNRSTKDFDRKRSRAGLHSKYSDDSSDLGNEPNYSQFIERTVGIYKKVIAKMTFGGHLVVIVKNVKKDGTLYPIAWDLARELGKHITLKDEKIWIQDKVSLAPYGYPNAWASNILHHYCLIFQKNAEKK